MTNTALRYARHACATIGLLAAMLLINSAAAGADSSQQYPAATRAAEKVLDTFMATFNRGDMKGWSATLNYPHVRFASGSVTVWPTREEFSKTPPFKALAAIGWDHSHWLSRDVVMASPDKVHIATTFERFNKANESIGVYQSLYIVTRVKGKWGIVSRSSLAP